MMMCIDIIVAAFLAIVFWQVYKEAIEEEKAYKEHDYDNYDDDDNMYGW
jgi:hypothetical protein